MITKLFYLILPTVVISLCLFTITPYALMYKDGINPFGDSPSKIATGADMTEPTEVIDNLNLSGDINEVFRLKVYEDENMYGPTLVIERKVGGKYTVWSAFTAENERYEPATYEVIKGKNSDYLAITSIGASGSGHIERYTSWFLFNTAVRTPVEALTYESSGIFANRGTGKDRHIQAIVTNDLLEDDSFVEIETTVYSCDADSEENNFTIDPKCQKKTVTKKFTKNEYNTFPEVDQGIELVSQEEVMKDAVLIR